MTSSRVKLLALLLTGLMLSIGLSVGFATPSYAATTLKTYPAPSGPTMSTDYTVQVRTPGGTWTPLALYQTRVGGPSRASNASFAAFDTNGPTELSVASNLGTVTSMKVTPAARTITPTVSGNTGTFTISGPMKLVVDVNGNVDQDLMLFANPLETNVPSSTDPNVIYYGPGYYTGDITVPSGKTLYLAGGAVVNGGVIADNVSNVVIRGRGILYRPSGKGVEIHNSTNVTVDGITVNDYGTANSGGYGVDLAVSNHVIVNNVKLFAYTKWTDGVDEMASNDINVNDSFIRTGDDSIAIYASRDPYYGSANGFRVTNSVLMPGNAHPINVGTHGDPTNPNTISNIVASNLDILTTNPNGTDLPISLTASDSNLVSDVLFSDIRWQDAQVGKFLDIITFKNPGYGLSVGRGITGVTVENFSYTGTEQYANDIYGYDSTRMTQNVSFKNLQVNGSVVTNAAAGNFDVNAYTSNITYAASSRPAIQSGHVYKLVNANSGKVLAVSGSSTADGAQVIQSTDASTPGQQWTLTKQSDGDYKLTNVNSGKALGVYTMSTADGAAAVQFADNGTLDHEWQLVASTNGAYKLMNRYSSKVLGITTASKTDGATALQWADNGTADHDWNLVLVK